MKSDDEQQLSLTPITGNPERNTTQTRQRRNHPIQICQHLQSVSDTPESPPPEDQGQRYFRRPYVLPNPSTSASYSKPPKISTVADGLQNLTVHSHPARSKWVTGCLVCEKSYDQVKEETVADYLNQTTQPGETV